MNTEKDSRGALERLPESERALIEVLAACLDQQGRGDLLEGIRREKERRRVAADLPEIENDRQRLGGTGGQITHESGHALRVQPDYNRERPKNQRNGVSNHNNFEYHN